jgi:hypothetical protein
VRAACVLGRTTRGVRTNARHVSGVGSPHPGRIGMGAAQERSELTQTNALRVDEKAQSGRAGRISKKHRLG